MENEQREITYEEAKRMDELNSKWFTPETNVPFKVTFSEAHLVPQRKPTYQTKDLPYEKQVIINTPVLVLTMDSLNGSPCQGKIYEIISPHQREAFRDYYENQTITRYTFQCKVTEMGKKKILSVSVIGEKVLPVV